MIYLLTALAVAQQPQVQAVHTRTAQVRALYSHGEVIVAATEGGLEFYSQSGERLAHVVQELPGGSVLSVAEHQGQLAVGTEFRGAATWDGQDFAPLALAGENLDGSVAAITQSAWVTRGGAVHWAEGGAPVQLEGLVEDAVDWQGGVLVATQEGYLHQVSGQEVQTTVLPCPVVDLYAEAEQVRIACMTQAYVLSSDGSLQAQGVAASAAGPGAWGTIDGRVLDDQGAVVGRVPARVTALERSGPAWFVGTQRGLYRLEQDLDLLTPEGQICGNFVTGATRFQGELLVSTFQSGACRFDGQRWHRIEGLPSELLNDVVVYQGSAYFATSHGLARWDGEQVEVYPAMPWGLPRGEPGTSNAAITALAVGERLWIADVVGPDSVSKGYWRRHRLSVFGTSYQAVAACDERAWVASEDAGVSQYTGRSWQHYDARSGLPDDWVMAVACQDKQAWAGTYRDGLWHFDGRSWTQIPTPDDWSLSLARGQEALWFGTLGGLYWMPDEGEAATLWTMDPRVHQISLLPNQETLVGTEAGLIVFGS